MKRLLITIIAMSCLFATPDPKGNWKLSGLAVDYLHIARETTPFYLVVDYPNLAGTAFASSSDCNSDDPASICFHLLDIPEGVMFNRLTNGPFTNTGLGGIGVNLNINVYDNGNGTIAQGSFYPDIELSESQACVTDLQIFSVNENFSWETGSQTTFSDGNVLGMPNGLLCDDDDPATVAIECSGNTDEAWGFGLITGLFDETPFNPVPVALPPGLPYIALTDGTILGASCQTALVGAACAALNPPISAASDPDGCALALVMDGQLSANQDGTGSLEVSIYNCELATNPAYGGTYAGSGPYGGAGWLHGTGTSSKFNINTGASAMCTDNDGNSVPGDGNCNPNVDFKLVWHAIDGEDSGLGFGDIDYPADGWDEDDDDSEFDRVFGVPYIEATTLNSSSNPLCDITGGTGQYLTPGSDHYGDENYTVNYALAGDIVGTLGDAGCDDDDASTPCCTELYDTYAERYACGEAVVAAFITGNCVSAVGDQVTAGCTALGGPANFIAYSCNDTVSDGIIDACENDAGGDPAYFAVGVCVDQVESNLSACDGDNVTWQMIIGNVCGALGTDCSEGIAAAQPIFDSLCAAASGGVLTTCAELAAVQGVSQGALECGLLTQEVPDGTGGTVPFYMGGCSQVVYPIVSSGLADGETCAEYVGTFFDATIDTFAQGADLTGDGNVDGLTCAQLGAYATTGVTGCDDAAWLDSLFENNNPYDWSCSDYGNNFTGTCLETNGEPNSVNETEMYLLNPAEVPAEYGYFVTFNLVFAQSFIGETVPNAAHDGYVPNATLADVYAAFPSLLTNDSDHDFDETCLYDGDPFASDTDEACSGRLRMTFEPTCVPEIEARQIVAEFVDLTDLCEHSGDVDYSCDAYDWNYNFLADVDEDGIDAADCEAFATATGQTYVVNNGYVLPSCDDEITTNCTEYSATVVWNAAYNMCGDGDPNDLIDLGPDGFCALAVPTGAFGDPAGAAAMPTCLGYYDLQGGIPSFEQNCTVGDGSVSVTDVVRIINHIIGNDSTFGDSVDQLGGEAACEADYNDDGNINVVDVVAIVNYILSSQGGRVADATEASISIENDKIVVSADGYIGAVDMIVEFTDNFSFDIADGFASTSRVNGNRAHIILIGDKDGISDVLTMTSGKIVDIEEVLVANSSDFVTTSINQPSIFSVGAAYPNPFNPSTNISLVLNANADLSVKVYNLTGQLVDVIAEGNYSPSSYNWTWKAENLASGVYFIKAQVGSEVSTQKVMLLK